jgi:hypothetical protein
MTRRILKLDREVLAELGTDDLRAIVGGAPAAPPTLQLEECFGISKKVHCGDITFQPRCF